MSDSSTLNLISGEGRAKWQQLIRTLEVLLQTEITLVDMTLDSGGGVTDFSFKITGGTVGEETGFFYDPSGLPVLFGDILDAATDFRMPLPTLWGGDPVPAYEGIVEVSATPDNQASMSLASDESRALVKGLTQSIVQSIIEGVNKQMADKGETLVEGVNPLSKIVPLKINGMRRRPLWFSKVNANNLYHSYNFFNVNASADLDVYNPQILRLGSHQVLVVYKVSTVTYLSLCRDEGGVITPTSTPIAITSKVNVAVDVAGALLNPDFTTSYKVLIVVNDGDYDLDFHYLLVHEDATDITSEDIKSTTLLSTLPEPNGQLKLLANQDEAHLIFKTNNSYKIFNFSLGWDNPFTVTSQYSISETSLDLSYFNVVNTSSGLVLFYITTDTSITSQLIKNTGSSYTLSGFSTIGLYDLGPIQALNVGAKVFTLTRELNGLSLQALSANFAGISQFHSVFIESDAGALDYQLGAYVNGVSTYVLVFIKEGSSWFVHRYPFNNVTLLFEEVLPEKEIPQLSGPITAVTSNVLEPLDRVIYAKSETTVHRILFP